MRHPNRHPTRQGHVALAIQQALAGQVNRYQRRRAGRLDVDARPAQVQLVRYMRRQVIFVVADQGLQIGDDAGEAERRVQIEEQVVAEARTSVYADWPVVRSWIVSRALERLP